MILWGPPGVGKTTLARLFSKAINCEKYSNGNICNECNSCKEINDSSSLNVIEIDAATHNSVEDIRDLVEKASYLTQQNKYKIYIIDEVHMLSKAAFNALLKTLEEPPEHVKFLFATTEVNKVPVTVLSRCQRFDLRRIPAEKLAAHFAEVSSAEGVEIEAEEEKNSLPLSAGSTSGAPT